MIRSTSRIRHVLGVTLTALLAVCSGAGGAAVPTEEQLSTVTRFVIDGDIDVTLDSGDPEVVVAEKPCAERIVWTIEQPTLTLATSGPECRDKVSVVELSLPRIQEIVIRGHAEMTSGSIRAARLRIETDTGGDLELSGLDCDELELIVAGGGDVVLSGRARRQRFESRGDGDVDASGLKGERGEVLLAGSGDLKVNVSEVLTVRAPGSGDIWYSGAPTVNTVQIGSGTLRRAR